MEAYAADCMLVFLVGVDGRLVGWRGEDSERDPR